MRPTYTADPSDKDPAKRAAKGHLPHRTTSTRLRRPARSLSQRAIHPLSTRIDGQTDLKRRPTSPAATELETTLAPDSSVNMVGWLHSIGTGLNRTARPCRG